MARLGKIERLPRDLRDALGERVLNGESFAEIAAWINDEPKAVERWCLHFPDNPRLTDDNLSTWRVGGGFARWKEEFGTRELADRCLRIAQASDGKITRGTAEILAGQIMAGCEALVAEAGKAENEDEDDEDEDEGGGKRKRRLSREDRLIKLATALKVSAEAGSIPVRVDLQRGAAQMKREALDLDKARYERLMCEKFTDWAQNAQALAIANSNEPRERKLEQLSRLFFGEAPEGIGPEPQAGGAGDA